MESKTNIKLTSRVLPTLAILLGIQQFTQPYNGWFMLLIGFGGAWILAYLWVRNLSKNLTISRTSHNAWAQIGDKIVEKFDLDNKGWASAMWVTIEDHSNIPDYKVRIGRFVEKRSFKKWSNSSICTTRGFYKLGPTTLHTTDPFGIYTLTLHNPETDNMLIIPPIIPLPSIQVADGSRIVDGQTRTSTTERTVSAAAVRQYVSGDDIQSIHWPTSARMNELHVRIYDNTPSSEWWIIIDLDENNIYGQGKNNTLEHSIILAASLADRGLKDGRSVGLTALGENQALLSPKPGNAQHWEILRSLAVAEPGKYEFFQVLNNSLRQMNKNTSAILITASNEESWLKALPVMLNRNISLTILHLDQVSFFGSENPEHILNQLTELNILHHRITSDIIQIPEFENNGIYA